MPNNIALQLALFTAGSVGAGENVVFDSALFSTGDISYDDMTGVITLREMGRYAFGWGWPCSLPPRPTARCLRPRFPGEDHGEFPLENPGAHIMGKYGNADTDFRWFLANGVNTGAMGLSAKILGNGEGRADHWISGVADYAELSEATDGNAIEPGYFVAFDSGEAVRKATAFEQ